MKKIDWTKCSAIAEILSAIAIVVTLLYLADQTKQLRAQTEQNNLIALNQQLQTTTSDSLNWAALIVENTETWTKGIAGAPMNELELAQFEVLAEAWFMGQFNTWISNRRLENVAIARRIPRDVAIELQEHPGLLEFWRRQNQVSELRGGPRIWESAVAEALATLESESLD